MLLGQNQIMAIMSRINNRRFLAFKLIRVNGKFFTLLDWRKTQRANNA